MDINYSRMSDMISMKKDMESDQGMEIMLWDVTIF